MKQVSAHYRHIRLSQSKSLPEEQAVATRKEKIGKRVDEKKKKMLRREHRPGKDNRRNGKTIKGVTEKNKEMPKKEQKHGASNGPPMRHCHGSPRGFPMSLSMGSVP